MEREQIEKKVLDGLRWYFNDSQIFENTRLCDYNQTPLDDIELLMTLEESLGVEINIDPAQKIETVSDLIYLVQKSI